MRMRPGVSQLAFAAVGVVVGVVLGGLGPRSELRALRAEAREESRQGRSIGAEVAQIFQGRGPAPIEEEPAPGDEAPPEPSAPDAPDAPAGEGGDPPPPPAPDAGPSPEDIAAMREAMTLRASQARQALVEDAAPDDDQLAEIDATFAEMNESLRGLATDFVARYKASGEEPSRRDMMAFAADTLDVLIDTEDSLTATLDPDQLEALSEQSRDPLSYVDGSIVDVLAELDGIVSP